MVSQFVEIPLRQVRVLQTGEASVKAILSLLVRDRTGVFRPVEFLMDPGSAISTMTVARAEEAGIVVPERIVEIPVRTAVGRIIQRRHPGTIRVRVPGIVGREFLWPCHFIESQDSTTSAALGLAGVLDDFRIIFDGRYSLQARYGWVRLELQR